ncbi:MAG: hypothetical protein A2Y71_13295 [Bacteroidetes bacterium RBG_13_42_15]|nr:MAG: hypothetical protein A2Y71_13295 [Bacteroidetes bacterium RBG_13_42_15]
MKNQIYLIIAFLILSGLFSLGTLDNTGLQDKTRLRIGTYDSRTIAVTYTRSDEFMKKMQEMNSKLAAAKSSGDKINVFGLEKSISKSQDILQKQVFSTYPVTEILDKVKDKIPEIAAKANVSCIVNKWAVDHMGNNVEVIDLTIELASLFADSGIINKMYPPSGIPAPQLLMEAEGIIEGTGIKDVYEEGPGCTVVKKDNKSNDFNSKMAGKWKAAEVFVHGSNLLGQRNYYFTFQSNGIVKVEEPGRFESEGEWILGLNENSIMLVMKDETNSLTGRYDFAEDKLIISGRGFIDPNEYVCITLKKQDP